MRPRMVPAHDCTAWDVPAVPVSILGPGAGEGVAGGTEGAPHFTTPNSDSAATTATAMRMMNSAMTNVLDDPQSCPQ